MKRLPPMALIAVWLLLIAMSAPVALAGTFQEGRITDDGSVSGNNDSAPRITNGVVYWQRGFNPKSVARWTGGTSFLTLWTGSAGEGIVEMDAASGKVVWATTQGRVLFYNGVSLITIKGAGNLVGEVATDGSDVVYTENVGGAGTDINWEVYVWTGGIPFNISNNPIGRDLNVDISNGKVAYQGQGFAPGSPAHTYLWPGSLFPFFIPIPAGVINPWDRTSPAISEDYVVWGTGHSTGHSYLLYHIPTNTTQNITGNVSIPVTRDPLVSSSGVAYFMNSTGWRWRSHTGASNAIPFGTYYEIQNQELIMQTAGGVHVVDGPSGSSFRVNTLLGYEPSFSGVEVVWSAAGEIWLYAPEGRVPYPFHNPECDSPPTPGSQSIAAGANFSATIQGSDVDSSDTLTLTTAGLPAGATLTPPLPTVGSSPISTLLSWTPTSADIGLHPFLFTITDNVGKRGTCEFTLEVLCSPTTEVCDGIDNDCDTDIDEDFGVGNACLGDGDCLLGVIECDGPAASRCSTATPEVCDGLDNDCDGIADTPTVEVNDGLDNQCPGQPGFGLIDEVEGVLLFLNPAAPGELSWSPPQFGATSYRVARSTMSNFSNGCTSFIPLGAVLNDVEEPAPGQGFHYLVQALTPNTGSFGVNRTIVCEPGTELTCDDDLDNDEDAELSTRGKWVSGLYSRKRNPCPTRPSIRREE